MSVQVNIKQVRRAESMLQEIIANQASTRLGPTGITYTDIMEASAVGSVEAEARRARLFKLADIRYELRASVEAVNHEQGIKERTAQMALVESKIHILDELKRHAIRSSGGYGTSPKEYTAGVSPEESANMDAEIRKLRLKLAKLKDSCGGINSTAKVTLSDEIHSSLVELGCI